MAIQDRTVGLEASAQILRLARTLPQSFSPTELAGSERQTLALPQRLGNQCGRFAFQSRRSEARDRKPSPEPRARGDIASGRYEGLVAERNRAKRDFPRLQLNKA